MVTKPQIVRNNSFRHVILFFSIKYSSQGLEWIFYQEIVGYRNRDSSGLPTVPLERFETTPYGV